MQGADTPSAPLQFGMGFGGPVSVIWGFIGCFIWSFFLALSMAEISSQYTVAGGPYCACATQHAARSC